MKIFSKNRFGSFFGEPFFQSGHGHGHGPWTVVHGPWNMDNGPWTMAMVMATGSPDLVPGAHVLDRDASFIKQASLGILF